MHATELDLVHEAHRLQPAEDLFDPLSLLLTDSVAKVPRCPTVNGTGPSRPVLGHICSYKGKPIQRISRPFKMTLRNAGITDLRFHDLRHCASTNLRRAGVEKATAMKILGHKSEKMWKRYNSIEERDLTEAALKVQKYLQDNTPVTLPEVIGEGNPFE